MLQQQSSSEPKMGKRKHEEAFDEGILVEDRIQKMKKKEYLGIPLNETDQNLQETVKKHYNAVPSLIPILNIKIARNSHQNKNNPLFRVSKKTSTDPSCKPANSSKSPKKVSILERSQKNIEKKIENEQCLENEYEKCKKTLSTLSESPYSLTVHDNFDWLKKFMFANKAAGLHFFSWFFSYLNGMHLDGKLLLPECYQMLLFNMLEFYPFPDKISKWKDRTNSKLTATPASFSPSSATSPASSASSTSSGSFFREKMLLDVPHAAFCEDLETSSEFSDLLKSIQYKRWGKFDHTYRMLNLRELSKQKLEASPVNNFLEKYSFWKNLAKDVLVETKKGLEDRNNAVRDSIEYDIFEAKDPNSAMEQKLGAQPYPVQNWWMALCPIDLRLQPGEFSNEIINFSLVFPEDHDLLQWVMQCLNDQFSKITPFAELGIFRRDDRAFDMKLDLISSSIDEKENVVMIKNYEDAAFDKKKFVDNLFTFPFERMLFLMEHSLDQKRIFLVFKLSVLVYDAKWQKLKKPGFKLQPKAIENQFSFFFDNRMLPKLIKSFFNAFKRINEEISHRSENRDIPSDWFFDFVKVLKRFYSLFVEVFYSKGHRDPTKAPIGLHEVYSTTIVTQQKKKIKGADMPDSQDDSSSDSPKEEKEAEVEKDMTNTQKILHFFSMIDNFVCYSQEEHKKKCFFLSSTLSELFRERQVAGWDLEGIVKYTKTYAENREKGKNKKCSPQEQLIHCYLQLEIFKNALYARHGALSGDVSLELAESICREIAKIPPKELKAGNETIFEIAEQKKLELNEILPLHCKKFKPSN